MEGVLRKADVNCAELLDRTSENILVVDKSGKIVFVNDRADAEFNHGENGLKGDDLEDHLEVEVENSRSGPNGTPSTPSDGGTVTRVSELSERARFRLIRWSHKARP